MERPSIDRVRRVLGRVVEGRVPAPAGGGALGADAALLMSSPLFDEEWYARVTGQQGSRLELVRHYLRTPLPRRASPNRLFDREFFAEHHPADLTDRDVFLVYLRRRAWRTPTHPLFDTRRYLRRTPGAASHPHGPLGHYQEVGAAKGAAANQWLGGPDSGSSPSLLDWVARRREEWEERRPAVLHPASTREELRRGEQLLRSYDHVAPAVPADGPLVSVLLRPGGDAGHLATSLRSLRTQSLAAWELLVLDDGRLPQLGEVLDAELPSGRWTRVPAGEPSPAAGLNRAAAEATGEWVAFLEAGDTWTPDRLRLLTAVGQVEEGDALVDVLRRVRRDGSSALVGGGVPRGPVTERGDVALARLLVRRGTLVEVGGFDEELPGAWAFDLVTRLAPRCGLRPVPLQGVTRHAVWAAEARRRPLGERPVLDHASVKSWADVVLNRSMIDWDELARRERDPGLVSVVIPTYADWAMTRAAVESVISAAESSGARVEVLVVDNGCDAESSVVLDSLPVRFEQVRVLHLPTNHGFALGNNLALPHVQGSTVVFLNNDTTVYAEWLEPLVAALEDPEVLGAQSLLLYPTGVIQSAGVAFPVTGGLPHAFLQGFPVEDADGVEELAFHALTGAALALRTSDAVALRGFDPVFRNGMEDLDVCLRLARLRPGRFTVRPDSRVTHHESQTPGRFDAYDTNRMLFLERWEHDLPGDDADLWASRGFRVVDRAVALRHRKQRRLGVPEPVLVRERPLLVSEAPPRLRWAIKNPAPFGAEAERWGDTHFARALADALREHGQEVVIDYRPEHERYTGRFDDVALVLRGLAPYRPSFEQVTIGWVISHPEMLPTSEAVSYDRLLAASASWAQRRSRDWGIRVEPMLQATDHRLFHPDLAVPDTGHPVLFVGGSRKEYRPIVRAAVEARLPISIYGSQWRPFVAGRLIKDAYLPNSRLGAAYRSAGVVLNDHWEDMRVEGFLSNRLFDAAASGARVVTDDVVGLGGLFGRSVQVMESTEHLVDLTSSSRPDEIFGSDEERREVAARIRREHSFRARAARLVEIAVEARRARGFDR
ncbi:glycosyltransferase [Nocardioides campestrisoli]|uniref:glycosyltransferase n=1 Tax=Nocardioides campestrisoli TaxID=2736757 RepID=UPI00163D71FF|nr:glycosyltransferase [Nocardioides campestrisoli]